MRFGQGPDHIIFWSFCRPLLKCVAVFTLLEGSESRSLQGLGRTRRQVRALREELCTLFYVIRTGTAVKASGNGV